ncbi:phospholipase D family protein [Paracoccus aminophilus]|uniref:Phospholipase D n=1 Tax=Paracoccus aminophilus JCM 7686 TaxID=1367847 RepID=S5XUI7_PARAH|nr:phospholipase D family protein [Paracoccus aminophilus]AGT11154.1 phospholipase D/transphosphatidylase [Paracoccus aminophilus JCM 7686]
MIVLKILLWTVVALVAAILVARLIFRLPSIAGRPFEAAIPADETTRLGREMFAGMRTHPGLSGFIPLMSGHDALGSRLELAHRAERSIDVQYYIWHDDTSGRLLLKALHDAALRGVRVRLLLDDNGIPGLDDTLYALNALEHFEVRLFNPSTIRRPKYAGYAFDLLRMNRRMHNKSYLVDGALAIIGGRNIGDEYFQVGDADFYLDLDVIAIGPIVAETAEAFDAYWNCSSVFALEQIVRKVKDPDALRETLTTSASTPEAQKVVGELTTSAERLNRHSITPDWTEIRLVVDDPIKGTGGAKRKHLMVTHLDQILGGVESELNLVSAYFVPGTGGLRLFSSLARTRRVRILTNALDTTDVLMVHAGYTKYRRRLLKAGVELFELKLRAGKVRGDEEIKRFGLSGASLHAKTFAIDQKRVFIGSFNFDPRSALLNCEMGFMIESPVLAKMTTAAFDGALEVMCYKPQLSVEERLVWTEKKHDGKVAIYQQEPGSTLYDQAAIVVIGVLPIEWLL